MRVISGILLWVCILLSSSSLWANGMRAHVAITEMALQKLPDGDLKKILLANKQAVLSGSYFPDSGYAAKDGYGEIAHWEPYLGAFLQFIRDKFQAPFDKPDAAQYVAFLMGIASHSMGDQCFDTLFMAKSRELDGDVDELDIAGDVFLVVWKKSNDPPQYWVPWKDAAQVFANVGHKVTEETIKNGMSRARIAQVTLGLLAQNDYERLKKKMPWAEKMLIDKNEPGALPYLAQVVANYWQVLWRRLQGENAMNQAILVSQPAPKSVGIDIDHQSITSQITFFFGYPLLKSTYTDANLLVQNLTTGNSVPIKISSWGARDGANTLKLRPTSDLTFDTEYKVTLQTGLQNTDKQALPSPYSFTFRTRPKQGPEPVESEPGMEPNSESTLETTQQEKVTKEEKTSTPSDGGVNEPNQEISQPKQGCGCDTNNGWMNVWLMLLLWIGLYRLFPNRLAPRVEIRG